MKDYIEFKIKKRTLIIICVFLLTIIGVTGWYFYSSYHPYIQIQVSTGTAGENLKIEAPSIAYTDRNGIPIASSINLKIYDLTMQHEFMCKSVKENYRDSNIKLKVVEHHNKTTLKYFGTATNLNGKKVNFNKKITVNYVLHADIK